MASSIHRFPRRSLPRASSKDSGQASPYERFFLNPFDRRLGRFLFLMEWRSNENRAPTTEPLMQLNRTTRAADSSTTKSSQTLYEVLVSCNKCGGVHEMGVSVVLENGPVDKQSIGAFYNGKTLPKNLADLANNSISCPKTGRQSTQKNNQQIFLVPPKSYPAK